MDVHFSINHSSDMEIGNSQAHFHDNFEILLSLSDDWGIFVGKTAYQLKRGTLAFVSAGTLHRYFAAEDTLFDRYTIHFPLETLEFFSTRHSDFGAIFVDLNGCLDLDNERTDAILWLIENCLRQSGRAFGDDVRRSIFFWELLLEFYKLLHSGKYLPQQGDEEFEKVAPIIAYIGRHLAEPISLDGLASRFNFNKYYLCHLFKSSTGFTIVEYITSRRILQACELLKSGLTVEEAGERSGFANVSHFIRSFRKLMDVTPGQYARANKSNILSK